MNGQNIKKIGFRNLQFLAAEGRKLQSKLCPIPLGSPPPPSKHPNRDQNMLYIGYLIIVIDQNIKKIGFGNSHF